MPPTALAIGNDARAYLPNLLIRMAFEGDVSKITPHEWKKQFQADVTTRRDEMLRRIVAT